MSVQRIIPKSRTLVETLTLTAAGAQTTNGGDINIEGYVGIDVAVDITAVGGTPTLVVTIQEKRGAVYSTYLATATISTTAGGRLRVYPGITAAANASLSDIPPDSIRISYTIAGTTPSFTGTIKTRLVA